eukprot:s255_g34.t1
MAESTDAVVSEQPAAAIAPAAAEAQPAAADGVAVQPAAAEDPAPMPTALHAAEAFAEAVAMPVPGEEVVTDPWEQQDPWGGGTGVESHVGEHSSGGVAQSNGASVHVNPIPGMSIPQGNPQGTSASSMTQPATMTNGTMHGTQIHGSVHQPPPSGIPMMPGGPTGPSVMGGLGNLAGSHPMGGSAMANGYSTGFPSFPGYGFPAAPHPHAYHMPPHPCGVQSCGQVQGHGPGVDKSEEKSTPKPKERREATKSLRTPDGDGDDGGDDDDSHMSSSAPTSEIRSMLRRRVREEQANRPKSSLGSVRIEEFSGDRGRYLKWKRTIQAQQCLYGLESQELAMLIYLSTKREARDVLEQHAITSYTGAGGLHLLWKVLDEAFGESESELFERADRELERYRRAPGESVAHFLAEMRRLRAQYYRIDPDSKFSDKAWAQKLLQKASLSRREKHDCYYAAGAVFDPFAIEKALRIRCGRIHEEERRSTSYKPAYTHKQDTSQGGTAQRATYQKKKKKIFIKKKYNTTHVAEVADGSGEEEAEDEAEPEEEGAEEEAEREVYVEDQIDEEEDGGPEDEESDGELDEGELKEAFAAGWKAKQKTAEAKKSRGWKPAGGAGAKNPRKEKNWEQMKKSSTCSSCGMKGHWKGDPECINVKSGKDPPHAKKANTVHFTFMVGTETQCHQCLHFSPNTAKFCAECGALMRDHPMPSDVRKRPTEEPDQDHWDVIPDHPKPFSYEVRRDTAQVAAKMRARPKAYTPAPAAASTEGKVRLHGQEVLAALPNMSKHEKKELHRALQEEEMREAHEAWEQRHQFMPDVGVGGYIGEGFEEPFPAYDPGRGSQEVLVPPEGKDKPKPVKEKELKEFRKSLYDAQVQGGRMVPSSAAPPPNEAQARCTHPFDQLRWSANGEGHYARCKRCDLKHVVYYSLRHGVMMVSMPHEPPEGLPPEARVWIREDKGAKHYKLVNAGGPAWEQVCCRVTKDVRGQTLQVKMITHEEEPAQLKEAIHGPPRDLVTEFWYVPANRSSVYNEAAQFIQSQKPGLAIADSGCTNAVGGIHWHRHYQQVLDQLGIPWKTIPEREVYKFGAGAPNVSKEACLYPVMIHGKMDIIRMSIVEGGGEACPGLIGPSELSQWKAVFRFADKQLELNGTAKPMQLTVTRHPGINLLEGGRKEADQLKQFWTSQEGEAKKSSLTMAPQKYAFLTGSGGGHEDEAGEESEETEDEEASEQDQREAKVEDWMKRLHHDLGIIQIPTVESQAQEEEEEEQSSQEEGAASDGSTSHEMGVEILTDDSTDEEEERLEAEKRHVFLSGAKKKEMHKSLRKRLGHNIKEIKGQYQEELWQKNKKEPLPREVSEVRPRRKRWTVLEVFTWTCAISIAASAMGWDVHEPVSLPRWDLLKDKDYHEALQYIKQVDPDLLVIAWPCTVWSPLQSFGKKTPWQRMNLVERRKEQRKLLRFVRDAAIDQRERGGALMGENPDPSLAWKEPLIEEAFEGQGVTKCDMCQFGLKIPAGPIRKRTRLRGTEEIMTACTRKCNGEHQHAPCLGGVHINGKWMNVSDFAGGYTSAFAKQVVKGAEAYLAKGRRREVFTEGGAWPEEDLEEEDQEGRESQEQEEEGPSERKSEAWKLQKIHERLDHPTNETLGRMLSLAGASKETIEAARELQCPVCQEVAPPGRYLKQRAEVRPTVFGKEVHCDLKYLHDAEGKLHVALSMVDAASSYHAAILLRNRNAEHVAKKMARHWCSIYGIPETLILDQGGEFDGEFIGWMESHGIHSKVSGARSAWQHGFAERHGALLGSACVSLIWQYKAKGRAEVKDCLAAAIQAKNMTMTRKGYTPYQLAFGRQPLFPDLLDEDITSNMSLRDALGVEGEVKKAAEMRTAARAVFLRQDVQDKIRRALKRWPRGEERAFNPGEMVYFYSPQPKTTRFRKDGGSWRGPAVVLMRESAQRYFISWRGRCLLVSAPNMRSASTLEAGDFGGRVQELDDLEDKIGEGENKAYEDLSHERGGGEEEEKPQAQGWKAHDGVITPHGTRSKGRAKEIAQSLRGMKTIKTVLKQKIKKTDKAIKKKEEKKKQAYKKMKENEKNQPQQTSTEQIIEQHNEEKQPASTAENTQQKMDQQKIFDRIDEDLKEALRGPEGAYKQRLLKHLQDDVPQQFKKRPMEQEPGLEEGGLRKRFRAGVFNYTMLSVSGERARANAWLRKSEVNKLSQLLDLPIVSARAHMTPRKRFAKPPKGKRRGRITVMLGEQVGQATVCYETAEEVKERPNRKSPYGWRGLTLFVKEEASTREGTAFVEMPDGLYEAKVKDAEEWKELVDEELDRQAFFEAFILQNKMNGKELDPRFFSPEEKMKFQESDLMEWKSWLQNKVIKRLSPEEIAKVDRRNVFPAPVRIVRVNKGAMQGTFQPKSRIVIPGHLDPHLGSFRSDAPTVPWVTVQLAKMVGVNKGWCFLIFDVTTAFLSGKEVDRDLLIKAPLDGLPACPELNEPAVLPLELMRVCKSAYGLSEAPRLWYLRARELLLSIGFEELQMAEATFIMKIQNEVVAILCLHVDDGLLVIKPSAAMSVRKAIDQNFNIKEWQQIGEKGVTFLGVKTYVKDGIYYDDMAEYINTIEYAKVETPNDQPLKGSQLSAYRRLAMQLRWPAHFVMPEFLYRTSELAQRVSTATGGDLKYANKLLESMKAAASRGEALTKIHPLKGELVFVSYFDASLGTSKTTRAQQGEIHFLTTNSVFQNPSRANIVEFHSNKVHRVVRSSLAAEGCSMTSAGDRQLYSRVILDAFLYGKTEVNSGWRQHLKTPGCLVTDAKGLHDHILKTGGVASEKQAALDMLMTKQLVEDGVMQIRWTPTWKQLADPLTKDMVTTLLEHFRRSGKLCLVQTPEDEKEEVRRAGIRKAQRERAPDGCLEAVFRPRGQPERCCVVLRVAGEDGVTNARARLLDALRAREAAAQSYFPESKILLSDVLEARERSLGAEHPDTLRSVNNLAVCLKAMGMLKDAEPLYRRAVDAKERTLGAEHPSTLVSVNNLASCLQDMGRLRDAEPLYRRALEARERTLGAEHPETLISVNNLASCLKAMGQLRDAEALYRRAMEASERTLGPEHPDTLATVNNLARCLQAMGLMTDAEPLYRRAVEASKRTLGAEHPDTLVSVNNLAGCLKAMGLLKDAEPLFRRALEARERTLGSEHPNTLVSVNNLAVCLKAMGMLKDAEPLYRRALEAGERTLGAEHPDTLTSVNNLAGCLYAMGRMKDAEPLFRRALEAQERTLGAEHPQTLLFAKNLKRCLQARGQL